MPRTQKPKPEDLADEALRDEAAKLRQAMELVPPRELGEPLSREDEARILELKAEGLTQAEIAGRVGCHQSTVSRTLAEYDDSRPQARKYLEAQAHELTKRLVRDAKPEVILRILGKLDVVRDDDNRGGRDERGRSCRCGASRYAGGPALEGKVLRNLINCTGVIGQATVFPGHPQFVCYTE